MPIFIVKRQAGRSNRYNPIFPDFSDTIVYKFQGFIEYNFNSGKIEIEEIRVSRTRCFGSCPVFDLTINKNRNAKLTAKAYMKQSGLMETKVEKKLFSEIFNLISCLKIDSLKEDYTVDATDNSSFNIEIIYNGKSKRIHDYGLEGTLGLQQFYDLIEKLIEKQNWK